MLSLTSSSYKRHNLRFYLRPFKPSSQAGAGEADQAAECIDTVVFEPYRNLSGRTLALHANPNRKRANILL